MSTIQRKLSRYQWQDYKRILSKLVDLFGGIINHNVKISMPEAIHKSAADGREKDTKSTTRRQNVLALLVCHISKVSGYFSFYTKSHKLFWYIQCRVSRNLHNAQCKGQQCRPSTVNTFARTDAREQTRLNDFSQF